MSRFSMQATRHVAGALCALVISTAAIAQGIPDDRNINVIGVNPPTAVSPVSDTGLKQQNEPSCAMKPSNPLHILCAFNDYRGVDDPLIGDAWEGYSYSINGGQTWFSDLLPGYPSHSQDIGMSFAADAQIAAAPGIAIISYIAANRGDNAVGGLFMQQMIEVTREAGAPWVPAGPPITIATGNADEFIDKPFMLQVPAPVGTPMVTINATLDDGTPVSRQVPAARTFIAYTIFSGTELDGDLVSKIVIAQSDDYGQTWAFKALANSSCDLPGEGHCKDKGLGHDKGKGKGHTKRKDVIQSAALAAYGDKVCAVWRRFEDDPDPSAIMSACSADRGATFTMPTVISAAPDFLPFDQGTTQTTFRTNSYPSIAHDGTQFYAFWTSRLITSTPYFARVVYSTSVNGTTWSAPQTLDATANGHQYMPSVGVAGGTVQIAWYDTRNNNFQSDFIQDLKGVGTTPDVDATKIIRNKADIRTAQIINGVPTASVQVSRYLEGVLEAGGVQEQLEFNFVNDRMFKQGTVPFTGDYVHVAASAWRRDGANWVSNVGPSSGEKLIDFLVSWSDNRDVRGNVWGDLIAPTEYTPADLNSDGSSARNVKPSANKAETLLADAKKPGGDTEQDTSMLAASLADGATKQVQADAEPDLPGVYAQCVPGPVGNFTYSDRSRNQNVYSSVVRPGVSFDSPSASKPTGGVQRAHVIWVSNNQTAAQTYTLTIENQPADAGPNGRASFLQVPVAPFADNTGLLTEIAVPIDANSTVARTVYVTSATETDPEITISVGDGGSVVFGTVTLNGDILSPDIQNPDIQNPDIQNPDIQNKEVHNPDIQNVVITRVKNPDIQNPDIQNPDIQNPDIQNPDIQNPDIQNPDIQNPDIQNTSLDASSTDNPDLANDTLTEAEKSAGYTDVAFEVTNDGNTTTSFNLDAFINGETAGLKTQLIAARTHTTETSRNCTQGKTVQNQIIFNKINPDLSQLTGNSDDGVFGDGSAYVAPGETIFVTLRVWGDPDLFDAERVGVFVESQSCNSDDKTAGILDCDPPIQRSITSTATLNFDLIPPLTNLDGLALVNEELERFGVQFEEQLGVVRILDAATAGSFIGLSGSSLGFNSNDASGDFDGSHTARFMCPDNSGRSATVDSVSVNVVDTESITMSATSFDISGSFLESFVLPDTGVSGNPATFTFVEGPIASIRFVDSGGDGHVIDDMNYTGLQCVSGAGIGFTETVITGDLDILNTGTFVVANNMNYTFGEVSVNGITFSLDQSGFTSPGGAWLFSGGDFSSDPITTNPLWSLELDAILSTNQFVPFGQTHGEFALTGLTPNSYYRLQLLFSNDLNTTANDIEVTVDGNTHVLDQWQDDAINLIVHFIAASPTVVVEFDALVNATSESGRGIVSAYAVHELAIIQ